MPPHRFRLSLLVALTAVALGAPPASHDVVPRAASSHAYGAGGTEADRGSRAGGARVELLPVPVDADVLLITPARGLALAEAHARLLAAGFDSVAPRPGDLAVRVRVRRGADATAVAARIAAGGDAIGARGVEPDAVVRAARVPDDPMYVRQARYLEVVHAPAAWEVSTGGAGVLIAIIDTGIAFDHPDLRDRIYRNPREQPLSGRDDDGNGCVADFAGCNFVTLATADPMCGYDAPPPNARAWDDDGHGSFVAGLAAAAGDNATGITGIAWQARLLSVKVLDCTATGRIADAAAGIRYAARMGADVINVSFGATNDSLVLREVVAEAQARGALVVASAGNDGRPGLTYPAAYPGVISVAASGRVGPAGIDYRALAAFTNFGAVDVMAPGVNVLSAVPGEFCGTHGWICTDGAYATASGSSFATPIVTGAVALLRARFPDVSAALLRMLLLNSRQAGALPGDPGLLDVGAALVAPVYRAGVPGVGRAGGGAPGGPAPR